MVRTRKDGFVYKYKPGTRHVVLVSTVYRFMEWYPDRKRLRLDTPSGSMYMIRYDPKLDGADYDEGSEPLVVLEQTDERCPCGACRSFLWKIVEEEEK